MSYFALLNKSWEEIDSNTSVILNRETSRQNSKLILSAALSICPASVREASGSIFCNIDAEGHLPKWIERESLKQLYDIDRQLSLYASFSDNRPNKNTEFANIIEKIAKLRLAKLFKTSLHSEEDIYVNLQPPTGAIANSIIFEGFLEHGDTILSMSLSDGGHLSHGSQFHNSSKKYKVINYGIDQNTGKLNYDSIYQISIQEQPKLIIAGASSYPWDIDWKQLRDICSKTKSKPYLMADTAHTAGLVVGGLFPNPIDYADFITMVTYKTFCGPRAAAILTTDKDLAKQINRTIFPGVLGSPIMQNIVALAVSAKIADTPEFKHLQRDIVENAKTLAEFFKINGIEVAYGGTSSHIVVLDLKRSIGLDSKLNGEIAAKVLEKCNIICNKNMLPGDETNASATGLRIGTTWITQLGVDKEKVQEIGCIIVDVIKNIRVRINDQNEYEGDIPDDFYSKINKRVTSVIDPFPLVI